MCNIDLLAHLRELLKSPTLAIDEEIQSLWSGYGQIIRCKCEISNKSYVVKVVAPANAGSHPRGWNTSVSHQRKLKSYQIEACFYQHYAKLTDANCKVPNLVASKTLNDYTLLVMEDLDEAGYFVRKETADWQSLALAVKWLAYFHVKFSNNQGSELWDNGSYWHLATRQDEYNAMPDNDYKRYAKQLDNALNSAQFKTLVHGDAKFANLCFHHNSSQVAAVDFQYIGLGSGVKDLAYLAGSCLNDKQLFEYEHLIVDEYITQVKQAANAYEINIDFQSFEQETKHLYPIAWADFYRFLLGWNPQSWKIGGFMKYKAKQGVDNLIIS